MQRPFLDLPPAPVLAQVRVLRLPLLGHRSLDQGVEARHPLGGGRQVQQRPGDLELETGRSFSAHS